MSERSSALAQQDESVHATRVCRATLIIHQQAAALIVEEKSNFCLFAFLCMSSHAAHTATLKVRNVRLMVITLDGKHSSLILRKQI